ncbi:glycerophosphodiester phosphodiesterase family protein [Bacillus cereus]
MNTQKNIDYKYECENFQSFYSQFKELGKGFFLAMHRGSFEYAPENSLSAIQKSMELGLFIIEIDVQMTKDGVIILMHDDSIDRMTNGSGEISELTYEQIKSFYLKDNNGGTDAPITKEKVPTLVEVMNLVKGRAIVNIDKCWGIRNKVCEVLRETGTFDYGLLKSDAGIDEVKEFLNSNGDNLLYMHKINEESMYQLELIIEEIAPIAFEVYKSSLKNRHVWTLNTTEDCLRIFINRFYKLID